MEKFFVSEKNKFYRIGYCEKISRFPHFETEFKFNATYVHSSFFFENDFWNRKHGVFCMLIYLIIFNVCLQS